MENGAFGLFHKVRVEIQYQVYNVTHIIQRSSVDNVRIETDKWNVFKRVHQHFCKDQRESTGSIVGLRSAVTGANLGRGSYDIFHGSESGPAVTTSGDYPFPLQFQPSAHSRSTFHKTLRLQLRTSPGSRRRRRRVFIIDSPRVYAGCLEGEGDKNIPTGHRPRDSGGRDEEGRA